MNEHTMNLNEKDSRFSRDDLWNLHWRLRDEAIYRKMENRNGGYFTNDDYISKFTDDEINALVSHINKIRHRLEKNADT